MLYLGIGWAVLAFVCLIIFFIKQSNSQITEDDVIYLPKFLFYFGVILVLVGGGVGAVSLYFSNWICFSLGAAALLLGIAAMLCQVNQRVTMTSNSTFKYSTMLGKVTEYSFSDVRGFKLHSDSATLIMEGGKIHIESIAIKSPSFMAKITKELV